MYGQNTTIQALTMANLDSQHLKFTVWRILHNTNLIANDLGPAYLIPIKIISGTPSLGLNNPQKPGHYLVYERNSNLTPALDCVFVIH